MRALDAVEGKVLSVLAREFGVPPIDLSRHVFPLANLALVPRVVARRDLVLPVVVEPRRVAVAMANPRNARVLSELRLVSGRVVLPAVSESSSLRRVIDAAYDARRLGRSHWVGSNVNACPWWERNLFETPADLRKALRHDFVRAARCYRAGDPQGARWHLERAIAAAPRAAAPHRLLGLLAASEGRLAEAQRELEVALQLRPRDPAAAKNLAVCLERRGDRARADAFWERTLEWTPPGRSRRALVLHVALR